MSTVRSFLDNMTNSKTADRVRMTTMALLLFASVALAVMNVMLLKQNRDAKAAISKASSSPVLSPGRSVPPLHGKTAAGDDMTISYGVDKRKTVLLVFSPGCGFCAENMPSWKRIVSSIDSNAFRMVAVSIVKDGAAQYLKSNDLLNIPSITDLDPGARVRYGMNITPETILIGSDGNVEKVWAGLIQDDDKQEIMDFLGVRLTGFTSN
jgi:peroxiredoxin